MSWNQVRIGDFLIVRDTRFKPNDESISKLKRIDKIDFSGRIVISDKPSNTDMILIKKGDLVISGINVEKGAMCVYEGEEDIIATIHYSAYQFDDKKIDIEFLKYFLRSAEFKSALKKQVPGGIKTEIKPKHLLPLLVEIPIDIDDQKEIVQQLKKQNAKLNSISEQFCHQQSLLKQLRRAFLKEAMQGKLVAQNPDDEPASELLKKIKAEKEQLVAAKKLKKEKELPPIKEEEIPFAIPDNWVWCRLGEICDFITKGTTPNTNKISREGQIPYLKVYNIVKQKIDFDYKPQFIDNETHVSELSRSIVYPGDVLMNIVGPPLGKVAIVPNQYHEWNINQALAIFRPIILEINKFLYHYLVEGSEIQKLRPLGVVGQDNLSLEQCRNIIFPLPPITEQHRIVLKLEELMKRCTELEESICESQQYNEKLLQQMLKEALRKEQEVMA